MTVSGICVASPIQLVENTAAILFADKSLFHSTENQGVAPRMYTAGFRLFLSFVQKLHS